MIFLKESPKLFYQAEADEAAADAAATEDRARKAMLDAARLAEELRAEQDRAQFLERERKDLEQRAHDIQVISLSTYVLQQKFNQRTFRAQTTK